MKNLAKLLLPLTFSTFLNFNSEAQDFLPGKFKNYQSNPKDTLFQEIEYSPEYKFFTKNFYYDLDKDSLADVLEMFLIDPNKRKISENPIFYILKFNEDKPYLIFILDMEMDGLNDNEKIQFKEDKNKNYINFY